MQPVPKPLPMQKLSNNHFRFGVLTPYPTHIKTPHFFTMYISHNANVEIYVPYNYSYCIAAKLPVPQLSSRIFQHTTPPSKSHFSFPNRQDVYSLYGRQAIHIINFKKCQTTTRGKVWVKGNRFIWVV